MEYDRYFAETSPGLGWDEWRGWFSESRPTKPESAVVICSRIHDRRYQGSRARQRPPTNPVEPAAGRLRRRPGGHREGAIKAMGDRRDRVIQQDWLIRFAAQNRSCGGLVSGSIAHYAATCSNRSHSPWPSAHNRAGLLFTFTRTASFRDRSCIARDPVGCRSLRESRERGSCSTHRRSPSSACPPRAHHVQPKARATWLRISSQLSIQSMRAGALHVDPPRPTSRRHASHGPRVPVPLEELWPRSPSTT